MPHWCRSRNKNKYSNPIDSSTLNNLIRLFYTAWLFSPLDKHITSFPFTKNDRPIYLANKPQNYKHTPRSRTWGARIPDRWGPLLKFFRLSVCQFFFLVVFRFILEKWPRGMYWQNWQRHSNQKNCQFCQFVSSFFWRFSNLFLEKYGWGANWQNWQKSWLRGLSVLSVRCRGIYFDFFMENPWKMTDKLTDVFYSFSCQFCQFWPGQNKSKITLMPDQYLKVLRSLNLLFSHYFDRNRIFWASLTHIDIQWALPLGPRDTCVKGSCENATKLTDRFT